MYCLQCLRTPDKNGVKANSAELADINVWKSSSGWSFLTGRGGTDKIVITTIGQAYANLSLSLTFFIPQAKTIPHRTQNQIFLKKMQI